MSVAIALAGMMLMPMPPAFAQDAPVLAIAVGDPGSVSYEIGSGLASVLQTDGLADGTRMRAELWESLLPADRVVVLLEEAQLAVVPAGDPEWWSPRAEEKVRAAVGLADGHQVLVRADLSDDFVYQLTELIFAHPDVLRPAAAEVGDLEPIAALERIEGTVHPGAIRYYQERTKRQAAAVPAAGEGAAQEALADDKSFTVYFDFDEAAFDPGQIGTVQEACGYAGTLPAAEFILSGHADTMGPEPYNDGLSLARAQSVAGMIRNDPRFRDALHVIRFGERQPAVPTGDGVAEPKNRRVVITVVPGKVDQAQLLAASAAGEPGAAPRAQP